MSDDMPLTESGHPDLMKIFDQIQESKRLPSCDMARCSDCGGEFLIADCPMEQDGDWETGYFDVPVCPVCEDGGCLDDYFCTPERAELINEWWRKHDEQNDPIPYPRRY